MKNVISVLNSRKGEYEGQGINHEGQPFVGRFSLSPAVHGKGVSITFTATGLDGTIYHHEQSQLAMSAAEKLCMWNLNTNIPGVLEHTYRREEMLDGGRSYVFGFGDPQDRKSFREEIGIDVWENGEISYRYLWGMPGGEFEPRSAVRMKPQTQQFDIWHVAIPVSDLERSVKFYCETLGFKMLGRDEYPSKKQAFIVTFPKGFTIELFEPKGAAVEKPRKLPDHLAFEARNLREYREKLVSSGFHPDQIEEFDSGVKYLGITDPDGVLIEFFEGREIHEQSLSNGKS